MKKHNYLILISLVTLGVVLLSSCGSTNEPQDSDEMTENSQAFISNVEILPYELSDSLTVTQVKTTLVARERDSAFTLVIQALRGENTFLDSVFFAVKKDDTARANVVFTQLPFDEKNPPKIELIYH
ncbi:hypothetical protein JCM31826_01130 [Thermaurantimonas aggregans]|uniref:Lipoprotein n=1 Tax=Thermaurantimonas aggregans TaxID=2173829 RepID=A0A401XHZ1_9FLAO|nr:hypothetical protein [Thermaurantimonas aggregans]GCD76631.1 hypothetical protein JCM31826_01130 [Thermaurantimonas aggregans]